MEEIVRMQDNLLLLRRTVGWTAEEFGEKIGVTRQTINNIESGRNKLTKTQYLHLARLFLWWKTESNVVTGSAFSRLVSTDLLVPNPGGSIFR